MNTKLAKITFEFFIFNLRFNLLCAFEQVYVINDIIVTISIFEISHSRDSEYVLLFVLANFHFIKIVGTNVYNINKLFKYYLKGQNFKNFFLLVSFPKVISCNFLFDNLLSNDKKTNKRKLIQK